MKSPLKRDNAFFSTFYTGVDILLQPKYTSLPVDSLELDRENPRIAKAIEYYGEDINAEAMALALKGSSDEIGTSFTSLRDSIKAYGGIISPVIVNRSAERKMTVIEGNTRLLIYREFFKQNAKGNWNKIPAMVYEQMNPQQIHSIRLQAHLVGPRNWDPYSKARYLHYLSTSEHLTTAQIVDYCGGNKREVNNYIAAFMDMEQYYRPLVGDSFDVSRFSAFVELQQKSIESTLIKHNLTKSDFAEWIKDNKFGPLQNIRKLPRVLNDPKAKEVFLAEDMEEAYRLLESKVDNNALDNATLEQLALAISKKIASLPYSQIIKLRDNPESDERITIQDAKDSLISLCNDFGSSE